MVTFIQPFTDVLVIEQREPATKRRSLRESSHLRQRFGQSSYPVIKLEPQRLNYQCQGEKIWLTHFKKVTRTICLKFIFDHKIDILKPGPLISKNKLIRDKRVTHRQQIWLQDCIYSDEEGPFYWETIYRMALRCTKAPSLLSFNFKLLHRRIATNDFFT